MSTKTYTIAATFADDHWERDCGQTDIEIKRTKTRVTVELDADGYRDMLTDADYYWDMNGESDDYLRPIIRSAKRVLDVLLREGPPPGYTVTRRGFSYRVDPVAVPA